MIRLTHRQCHTDLAEAHTLLEGRKKELRAQKSSTEGLCLEGRGHSISLGQQLDETEADLADARQQLAEIKAACEDVEYARDHAVIPDYLREKLLNADDRDFVLGELAQALAKIDDLTEQLERGTVPAN